MTTIVFQRSKLGNSLIVRTVLLQLEHILYFSNFRKQLKLEFLIRGVRKLWQLGQKVRKALKDSTFITYIASSVLFLKFVFSIADRAEEEYSGSKALPATTLLLPTMELLLMKMSIHSNTDNRRILYHIALDL